MNCTARTFCAPAALLSCIWFVLFSCVACDRSSPIIEGGKADRIIISKSNRNLILMNGSQPLRTYTVALGRGPVGAKMRTGDHQTPEGNYVIDTKKNHSRFHLALHISYPNQSDRERAQRAGIDPGGDIEIHGIENGLGWIGPLHRRMNWTDGCIAVTDDEMDEIWKLVPVGTPVEIRP